MTKQAVLIYTPRDLTVHVFAWQPLSGYLKILYTQSFADRESSLNQRFRDKKDSCLLPGKIVGFIALDNLTLKWSF